MGKRYLLFDLVVVTRIEEVPLQLRKLSSRGDSLLSGLSAHILLSPVLFLILAWSVPEIHHRLVARIDVVAFVEEAQGALLSVREEMVLSSVRLQTLNHLLLRSSSLMECLIKIHLVGREFHF